MNTSRVIVEKEIALPNGVKCKVHIIQGEQGLNPFNDNVDVIVTLNGQKTYAATFFTIENIDSIMKCYMSSGECLGGLYFWCKNMIIVRRLDYETIVRVIGDLIQSGEFSDAFGVTRESKAVTQ